MVSRKRTAAALWLAAAGLLAASATAARAQTTFDPIAAPIVKGTVSIELQRIATGLTQPNTLTHAGDGSGRRFIVERNGIIRVLGAGAGATAATFLNASERVLGNGERGMLGMAFHPGYADPLSPGFGKFYTYTSEAAMGGTVDYGSPNGGPTDHHTVITEWSASANNPNVADPNSRREILRIAQPQDNHNGGAIHFSPADGYLYIAVGDGGNSNDSGAGHTPGIGNGRDTTNVLGDILRIDPLAPTVTAGSTDPQSTNGRYRIPADNPFVAAGNPGADEIYASGFRNPYRMSFDAANGRLLAGDVGQGAVEEVNIVTRGGNYGWNQKEGSYRFFPGQGVSTAPVPIDGLIDPVLEYDHSEGISVIGGYVYRGTELGALVGKYIFGDFNGRLFVGDLETGDIRQLVIGADDRSFGFGLIGFGEDQDRELYALKQNGDVFRILATPSSAAVPEPGTLALLGVGLLLGGAAGIRRRRAG